MPKQTERNDQLGLSTPILSQNSEKNEGVPFGELFSKKVSQCQKTERGFL